MTRLGLETQGRLGTDLGLPGRDRGVGTVLPATDLRHGDVYRHTSLGPMVYTGLAWRQLGGPHELTAAQRAALATGSLHRSYQAYETDTGVLLVWSGTAWRVLDGAGFARYSMTSGLSAPVTPSNDRVPFAVAEDTHGDVTPNAAFDIFTLNRAGVWRIDAALRFSGAPDASRNQLLIASGNMVTPYIAQTEVPGSAQIFDLGVGTTKRFPAGATICVQAFSSAASGVTLDTAGAVSLRNNVSFIHLRS